MRISSAGARRFAPVASIAAVGLALASPQSAVVRHISAANVRVHCIDGTPADLSFVSFARFAPRTPSGKTVQDVALKPGTPVHVIHTQSLGIRHAYNVFVADPSGHGLYGFMT